MLLPVSAGYVLCISEGSVHGGLQHVSGIPNHRHGHPVQVQVSKKLCEALITSYI